MGRALPHKSSGEIWSTSYFTVLRLPWWCGSCKFHARGPNAAREATLALLQRMERPRPKVLRCVFARDLSVQTQEQQPRCDGSSEESRARSPADMPEPRRRLLS